MTPTVRITHFDPSGRPVVTACRWSGRFRNLADMMEQYTDRLRPAGRFAYVSEYLGYPPFPAYAEAVGDTTERWTKGTE